MASADIFSSAEYTFFETDFSRLFSEFLTASYSFRPFYG